MDPEIKSDTQPPTRRSFIQEVSAVVIGAIAALVPFFAGLAVLFDPVRRKGQGLGDFVAVASLEALPSDGSPRKFTVVADRSDAWNKYPHVPVGAVYLRRVGEKQVEALNVVCPHAGCFVDYLPDRGSYLCPCHNSTFTLEGNIKDAKSPTPRPLDKLPAEIRNGGEIWVKFQNFRAGTPEKIAVA